MMMQLQAQMPRQEERRERQMQMTTNKVTNHRTAPVPSSGNSSNTVPDINMVKRTFSRLKSESNNEIENLNRTLDEDKPEQYIRRYVKNLYRCKARIEQILDEKIDLLDGNIDKDDLLEEIYAKRKEIDDTSVCEKSRIED